MPKSSSYPCPCCQIGQCQPSRATFTRLVGRSLVSVPDTRLWTCDICGFREFDREAVAYVETLIRQTQRGQEPKRLKPVESPKVRPARRAKT